MNDREYGLPDDVRDEIAAYVLGALDPEHADGVRARIARDPELRQYERWLQGAADVLPASVEQLAPPAGLRDRIVDEVRSEAEAMQRIERVRRRPGRLRRLLSALAPPSPALAAAAVAVVLAGVGGYVVGSGPDPEPAGELTVAMQPSRELSAAHGELIRHDDRATILIDRLPALSDERVYQLWLRHGERVVPSATFTLHEDGSAVVEVPESVAGADELMISREPVGGSEEPTSKPLLRAPLS